jgi:hypothetical protein
VYQIIRKQVSPDEQFGVSDGVEVDPDLMWSTPRVINEEAPVGRLEVVAVIFLDEENPPVYRVGDAFLNARPYALIRLDGGVYRCQPLVVPQHGSLGSIKSPNIDEVIVTTVTELDELLSKPWWRLEPWLSAPWGTRVSMLMHAFVRAAPRLLEAEQDGHTDWS